VLLAKGKTREAKQIIKGVVKETQMLDAESLKLYSQILIEEMKLDKAFMYLNHAVKLEYRDSSIWQLLGEIYLKKGCQTKIEADRQYNNEKAVFCFTKATKYDSIMGNECVELLKLIPKYIN
jgi:predicted Zn-dependent protease